MQLDYLDDSGSLLGTHGALMRRAAYNNPTLVYWQLSIRAGYRSG